MNSWFKIFLLFFCVNCKSSTPSTSIKTPQAKQKVNSEVGSPPKAHRQNIVDKIHGQKVVDPYRWLEDIKSEETKRWIALFDRYTRKILAKLPGRSVLENRLQELSYIDQISAPFRRGKRYFFSRQHVDREKIVWYWQEGEKGTPKILIDPNLLSKDGSISLSGISISWNGEKAAYKLSKNAADEATLYVMDVGTGKTSLVDVIEGARYAYPSWTPKADGFYYTRLPVEDKDKISVADMPGHAAVYFHKLGDAPSKDKLIHPKTGDPRTFIFPQLSRDGTLLFIYIEHGWTQSDVYYKDLKKWPKAEFKPFITGCEAIFSVHPHKRKLYVYTNDEAPKYRVFLVDPDRVRRSQWKELVFEQKDAVLTDISIVGDHLSLNYLRNANTEIKIANLKGKIIRNVELPGYGTAEGLDGHPDDDIAYFAFSSFIIPQTIYRTSVLRGGPTVYFRPNVPIDPSPYQIEQTFYPSKDGTKISMFIVRRKDMPMDGTVPFLLYGYGGFNVSITSRFIAQYFVWLEQGGGIAIPNLRGGSEYGEKWHREGMLTKKQNVFDDFISAAEYLIQKKYTSSNKLVIRGGSNGGLLVGAAMTQRPELFRAVACHVPLLDMVRYHLFGSGKTWISEYGSAENPEQFKALYAYSPYHRVKKSTAYPALIMFTADSDDRVDPMHARKFVAAVKYANLGNRPILLRVETNAGHGGGDMVKKKVDLQTDELAFLMREIGIVPGRGEKDKGKIRFSEHLCSQIANGKKEITLRNEHRKNIVKEQRVFLYCMESKKQFEAIITEVRHTTWRGISQKEIADDGFENAQQMFDRLSQYYPKIKWDDPATVYRWKKARPIN